MFIIKTGVYPQEEFRCHPRNVWVCIEEGGWVEATGMSCDFERGIPKDIKTFDTKEDADRFIKRWKGHPWYYKPNEEYEIIEVIPKYKQVQDGWEVSE